MMLSAFIEKYARLLILGAIVVAIVAGLLVLKSCSDARTARTEAKISKGQTGAAIESGKEAVNIIGNRQATEQEGATNVQEARDAIDNATDASGVTGAGLDGLHSVRGRETPRSRR
jgi:hypothetical protein